MGIDDFAIPFDNGAEAPQVTDELARWVWAESGTQRTARDRSSDGAKITYPGRNNALASLAGSMRRRGMSQPEIEAALLATNATRVEPPLEDVDVRRIAKSVSRYEVADDVLKLVERGQADPVYGDDVADASLQAVTLKQISEMPDPGYKPLLGPFVYRGLRTLVGAATGEGKTTLVMWMLRAIIKGEGFLGHGGIGPDEEGNEPTVLIIDAEQSIPDIQRLANEIGMSDSESIHYITVPDGLQLGQSTSDTTQVEKIIESLRPDVVVVDPAYKVASIDSNNEREVVDLMRLFDRWRADYGFAFVMPVHTRKGDKSNPGNAPTLDDIFGSGAFSRGAEVILGLKQGEPGYSRLYVWKHRPGELSKGINFAMAFDRDRGFSEIQQEKLETVDRMIFECIRNHPQGISYKTLQERTGKSYDTCRGAISRLGSKVSKTQIGRNVIFSASQMTQGDEMVTDDDIDRWEGMVNEVD